VPTDGPVRLQIFSASGVLVRSLVTGSDRACRHQTWWNGRDEQGRAVRNGLYFYRLETGSTRLTRKLVKLG
jgi:flagellar hook assembly protein FlgD